MRLRDWASDMQRVLLTNVVPTPWKNQRGLTQELLAWPEARNWGIRLSVATIDDGGEFSGFEGVTRWFTVIDGQGVELVVGGQQARVDTQSDPFCFDGAQPCRAQIIGGAVRALNVMFAPGVSGQVVRLQAGSRIPFGSSHFWGAYSIGRASGHFGNEPLALEPGELVWMANAPSLQGSLTIQEGQCVMVTGKWAA